jgi:hypothetical protein
MEMTTKRMVSIIRKLDPWELVGLAAVVCVTRGAWMIYRPAAWIFVGAVCGALYVYSQLPPKRKAQ